MRRQHLNRTLREQVRRPSCSGDRKLPRCLRCLERRFDEQLSRRARRHRVCSSGQIIVSSSCMWGDFSLGTCPRRHVYLAALFSFWPHRHADAARVEAALGLAVLRRKSKKPKGFDELLRWFNRETSPGSVQEEKLAPHELCMVGDRALTDVVFGNLHGMLTASWLLCY
jgi:hypothetical protein